MSLSRALTAIAIALVLSGCGFRALYGTAGTNHNISDQLAQIRIETIPDRTGQQLRNFLLDRLNPNGQPTRPLYYLLVTINIARTDLGIERDETATRAILVLSANYRLVDRSKKTTLLKGSTNSTNSFNIVTSEFATLSAETDATKRASRDVSENIKTRLALYFTR